jgi:hypothetical protein
MGIIAKPRMVKGKLCGAGSHHILSETMHNMYRQLAATGLFGVVYDNINWMATIAEQTLGKKGIDSQFDMGLRLTQIRLIRYTRGCHLCYNVASLESNKRRP